jgi:hypothetical protein
MAKRQGERVYSAADYVPKGFAKFEANLPTIHNIRNQPQTLIILYLRLQSSNNYVFDVLLT